MKLTDKDNLILNVIRFSPPIFIIILLFLTTLYINKQQVNDLELNKKDFREIYISSNKQRIQTNLNTVTKFIDEEFLNTKKELRKKLKMQVNNASNIMYSIYNKYKDTKSKKEITEIIKTALKEIKFNEDRGYFFIYDLKGTNVFHPAKPHREGKNYLDAKDVNGTSIIKESIEIAKSKEKEGFQTWFFHKPKQILKEYEKLGYIKKFEPYNWYVGTGEYIKDFEGQIKKKILKHLSIVQYTNEGYVFIINKKNNIILNGNSNLLGKNISTIDSPSFILEINKFINSNIETDFLNYKINAENNKTYSKISYIKKLKKPNWIIGLGFNLDNINSLVDRKLAKIEENHEKNNSTLITVAFLVATLLLIISYFVSKHLEKRFIEYREKLYEKEVIKFENMLKELREILDNLPMMIIYKDIKNNIITVNKHTADSMGMKREELENVASKNIYPNDHEKYYQDDLEVIKTKKAKIGYVERYESKEGLKIIESSKIPTFDENGNVTNIILFMSDITEKEQLREDSENKERLLYQQSKLATMGEMISNIAHQWRQPLSTISTAATGMKIQKEMGCLDDKQFKSAVEAINNSAQYLSHTIDDFRNFFRPNQNRYSDFFISKTIEKTLNLIVSKIQTLSIEIIKDIEEVELKSLENEIIQILINILNNARDELVKNEITRKLIFIKTYTQDNKLFIEIKDNANGIKEEHIQKIFEPYFTTKPDQEGTGIGLYICKDILNKLLDGNISVENETYVYEDVEYTGAKFIVEVPY